MSLRNKLCCGDRDAASEADRRRAAATGRPPKPEMSFVESGNAFLDSLQAHLFGVPAAAQNCCGTRDSASEADAAAASETGRPPPPRPEKAPLVAGPDDDNSSDDAAGPNRLARKSEREQTKACPHCHEPCELRHRFCPSCGRSLEAVDKKKTAGALGQRHMRAADQDFSDLLPPEDEEDDEYARPTKSSPKPQSTREAPKPRRAAPDIDEESAPGKNNSPVMDDVMADYYRLRGITPPAASPSSSPAFNEVRPPNFERRPANGGSQASSRSGAGSQLGAAEGRGGYPSTSSRDVGPSQPSPHASGRPGAAQTRGGADPSHSEVFMDISSRTGAPAPSAQASTSMPERSAAAPKESSQPPAQSSPAVPVKAVPAKGRWSWPAWALDNKQPCIEVFVEDEETQEGRWIKECTPLHRVVHPDGYDQFLACEYIWDGEPYEQDFEPHHVRPRWTSQTVLELAQTGTLEQTQRR